MNLSTTIQPDEDLAKTPQRLSLLYLSGVESPPDWLSRALRNSVDIEFRVCEVLSLAAMLEQFREAPYDVALVDEVATDRSPRELMDAVRSGAHHHQAVVVLTDSSDRRRAVDFLAAGAAAYLSARQTTPAELVWQLSRAAEQHRLASEAERLRGWCEGREAQECQAIHKLLEDETALVAALVHDGPASAVVDAAITQRLGQACGDLLQAYLLLGRDEMQSDVRHFAIRLRQTQLPLAHLLSDYLQAVQALVAQRGARSARHVLDRGHLLLLEILLSWTGKAAS